MRRTPDQEANRPQSLRRRLLIPYWLAQEQPSKDESTDDPHTRQGDREHEEDGSALATGCLFRFLECSLDGGCVGTRATEQKSDLSLQQTQPALVGRVLGSRDGQEDQESKKPHETFAGTPAPLRSNWNW